MQGLQPPPQHWDGEGCWGLRASQSCSFPLIVCKTQALHQKQHAEEWQMLISTALSEGLSQSLSSISHRYLRALKTCELMQGLQCCGPSTTHCPRVVQCRNARHCSHCTSLHGRPQPSLGLCSPAKATFSSSRRTLTPAGSAIVISYKGSPGAEWPYKSAAQSMRMGKKPQPPRCALREHSFKTGGGQRAETGA